jgi:hypothetical protein
VLRGLRPQRHYYRSYEGGVLGCAPCSWVVASLLRGGERRVDAWLVYPGAAVEVLGLTSARGDSDSLHMGNDDRECIVSAW